MVPGNTPCASGCIGSRMMLRNSSGTAGSAAKYSCSLETPTPKPVHWGRGRSFRRVWLAGVTANPDGAWVSQRARNLAVEERLGNVRYLIHDRDAKFCGPFDAIYASEGVRVIETPVRAPRANAVAERWVRSVRTECLDHLPILGRGHLERVLRGYVAHYGCKSSRWTAGGSFARVPCWARVTAS